MKKSTIFWIFLGVMILILLVNLFFHFVYFNSLHKNIKPASESEKEGAVEILNESIDLTGYQIRIWNVYTTDDKRIIQVDLVRDSSKKKYLLDLNEGKILKK